MRTRDSTSAPAQSFFITQDPDAYTAEDHAVWSILYERRMQAVPVSGFLPAREFSCVPGGPSLSHHCEGAPPAAARLSPRARHFP